MLTDRPSRLLYLAVVSVGSLALLACGVDEPLGPKERRHVILFIGDGMHLEHEIAASRYLTGTDDGLSFHGFGYRNHVTTWDITTYDRHALTEGANPYAPDEFEPRLGYDPDQGGMAPYPLSEVPDDDYFLTPLPGPTEDDPAWAPATDSAAAATAMATGHKTVNGRVARSPRGALPTIAEQARSQRGLGVGAVTSVPFSHATPAAFLAHHESRYAYPEIAQQIVEEARPDVVIGGGHPGFGAEHAYLSEPTHAELRSAADWVLVERTPARDGGEALQAAADRARAQQRGLFGLFGGANGAFEPARPVDFPGSPTFYGGSTENPTTAEATRAALEVLSHSGAGFFLVVEQGDIDMANHQHDYGWMIGAMRGLDEAVRAAVDFVDRPDDAVDWANTLIVVTSDHGHGYLRLTPERPLGRGELPDDLTPHVSYATNGHTNELVMVYATGGDFEAVEGAWYPGTDLVDHTHLYWVMATFLGLDVPRTLD